MNPLYIIEVHQLGWLIKAPPGQTGVPMDAISHVTRLCPRNAAIHPGIANAMHANIAIATVANGLKWQAQIADANKNQPPEHQWFYGTDTGLSSMTLFAALATDQVLAREAKDRVREGYTPSDADDFGRCKHLLEKFPHYRTDHWAGTLSGCFPKTRWPEILARWDELCRMDSETLYETLRSINHT